MRHAIRISALFAVLAVACGGGTTRTATSPTATPQRREEAPDFTLATFEGDTFTLSDHFGELPVVLNFWAPW